MQLTILLPTLYAAFGLVQALPHPRDGSTVVVQIPAADGGMDPFIDGWTDVCTLWPPFNTNGLPTPGNTLLTSSVVRGDLAGNNPNIDAQVLCTWSVGPANPLTDITTDVANFIGATILQQ
ncbi:hypothetical protein C8R45DRAFT_1075475 [Mycena sanguinolenta]|nr:hypothetical protein C8R45DRAFT_1075475 [Mycena sanguinolenta]